MNEPPRPNKHVTLLNLGHTVANRSSVNVVHWRGFVTMIVEVMFKPCVTNHEPRCFQLPV